MDQVIYITLDKKSRVVYRNFWYSIQTLSGGKFRPQGSTRSRDGAIAAANI